MDPEASGTDQLAEAERRDHRRRDVEAQGRITLEGQVYHVQVTDLGRGGLCCKPLPFWARRGDPVMVELETPQCQLLGRVAWRKVLELGDDDVLVGVRFSRPHPEFDDGDN